MFPQCVRSFSSRFTRHREIESHYGSTDSLAEPSQVQIHDVRCGHETVSWRAIYRTRHYHAHADGLFLRVTLTRVG